MVEKAMNVARCGTAAKRVAKFICASAGKFDGLFAGSRQESNPTSDHNHAADGNTEDATELVATTGASFGTTNTSYVLMAN